MRFSCVSYKTRLRALRLLEATLLLTFCQTCNMSIKSWRFFSLPYPYSLIRCDQNWAFHSLAALNLAVIQVGSPAVLLRLACCTSWVKRWSEAIDYLWPYSQRFAKKILHNIRPYSHQIKRYAKNSRISRNTWPYRYRIKKYAKNSRISCNIWPPSITDGVQRSEKKKL